MTVGMVCDRFPVEPGMTVDWSFSKVTICDPILIINQLKIAIMSYGSTERSPAVSQTYPNASALRSQISVLRLSLLFDPGKG